MIVATQNISRKKFDKAAFIIKAVAHPKRLAIIEYLYLNGKTSVGDIVETLQCEQSCISHHLIGMKLRGILDCEKDGQNVYYWLKMPDVICLLNCVEDFGKFLTTSIHLTKK
jgi:DNA-binding transcriptional ArsR family regulator